MARPAPESSPQRARPSKTKRPGFLRQVAPLLVSFALVAAISLYLRHAASKVQPADVSRVVIETLPEAPNLADWPPELRQRLAENYDARLSADSRETALEEIAFLYHANGFVPQAHACYLALQAIAPTDARWPYLLAALREDFGDRREVIQDLERSFRLDPSYEMIPLKLGFALMGVGRPEAAKAWFERRLQRLPGDPWALEGLARIAISANDYAQARTLLEQALESRPSFGQALALLPDVCIELGDIEAAKSYRRRSVSVGVEIRPPDPRIDALQAYCYDAARLRAFAAASIATDAFESAWKTLLRAHAADPEDPDTLIALGKLFMRVPASRGAWIDELPLAAVEEALRVDGDGEMALRLVEAALEERGETAALLVEKGRCLIELGRLGDAEAAFRKAIELDANEISAFRELGVLLMRDRPEEGAKILDAYLARAEREVATRVAVGLYRLVAGSEDEGIARLEEAWAIDPDFPDLRDQLVSAYLRKASRLEDEGAVAAARDCYERILEIQPDETAARDRLGR